MKKMFFMGSICACLLTFSACTNSQSEPATNTHTHEDGSTHSDHAPDTVKPEQQEFTIGDTTQTDSSATQKVHSHEDGKPHFH
jgi:hypothetical protein